MNIKSKPFILTSIIITVLLILIIIFFAFFNNNETKNSQIGNNMSNQEILDYILNIKSYEMLAQIEVSSNKNNNKYILKQQYISPNKSIQEVIEPSNIQGIKIIKQENELKLENSKLNLTKIISNYDFMADNCLDLISFIEEYKKQENVKEIEEKENQLILNIEIKNGNKYTKFRTLYIEKNTGRIEKIEIKDASKNMTVYILYNEVKLNN